MTSNHEFASIAFDILNEQLFENGLNKPILSIENGRGEKILGCYGKDLLGNNVLRIFWSEFGGAFQEETWEDILDTLLHEMCHVYAEQNGIKDCDGQVHLEAFAEIATNHGLYCFPPGEEGYNGTWIEEYVLEEFKTRYEALGYQLPETYYDQD